MLPLTLIFGGCASTGSFTAQQRHVAPGAILVPGSAARPVLHKGDDLGVFAGRALDYGDENARRLLIGRCMADDQSVRLASAGKQTSSALSECVALRKAK